MHQFLYDHNVFFSIVCLIGMGWSFYTYYQAFQTVQEDSSATGKPANTSRSRARMEAQKQAAAATVELETPRAKSIQGEQSDLLSALQNQAEPPVATPIHPAETETNTDTDNKQENTVKGDTAHHKRSMASTRVIPKIAMPAPPQKETAEKGTENTTPDITEAIQEAATKKVVQALSTDFNIDLPDDNIDTTTHTQELEEEPTEDLPSDSINPEADSTDENLEYETGILSSEQALRKASRMEELGLHIGINKDGSEEEESAALEQEVDNKQKQRLADLGLGPQTKDKQRMITSELNSILDRLDDALDDDAEAEAENTEETPPIAEEAVDEENIEIAPLDSVEHEEEIVQAAETVDTSAENNQTEAPTTAIEEETEESEDFALPSWAMDDAFDEDIVDEENTEKNTSEPEQKKESDEDNRDSGNDSGIQQSLFD